MARTRLGPVAARRLARGTASLVAAALAAWAWTSLRAPAPEGAGAVTWLGVERTLGEPAGDGYRRVLAPRPFSFPADHGAHPGFKHEWWYLTGNLAGADGRPFGFQLTVFRNAVAPGPPASPSAWATNQFYMGHFAVTDVEAGRFHHFERFARNALGLAGVEGGREVRVWLEDWQMSFEGDRLSIAAAEDGVALSLTLDSRKPVTPQGDRGFSKKGEATGNASHYYSMTRLDARGSLVLGGAPVPVTGSAWFDHEWSTSALGPGLAGWDWFSLQLDDGTDLMFYRLRRRDGGADPASAGSVVGIDGAVHPLAAGAVEVEVLDHWQSEDGVRYPGAWRLRVAGHGITLRVEPLVAGQEWRGAFRYWEGAVRARGASGGRDVAGHGYVELTGYAGR